MRLPIANSVMDVGVQIGSSDEDMPGEGGSIIRPLECIVGLQVPIDTIRHFIKCNLLVLLL